MVGEPCERRESAVVPPPTSGRGGWLALSSLVFACTSDPDPKGQLRLAISTDMTITRDLDHVDVILERENGQVLNETVALYPAVGGAHMPGTFGIVEGNRACGRRSERFHDRADEQTGDEQDEALWTLDHSDVSESDPERFAPCPHVGNQE